MTKKTKNKRRLRNYLLLASYQRRYITIMLVLSVTLMGALGTQWYGEMRTASAIVYAQALSTLGEAEARHVQDELAARDRLRILVLAAVGLFLCLAVVGSSIVLSHKVAGPLHVIGTAMDALRDGRSPFLRPLRKGDALTDHFDRFKRMKEALEQAAREDAEALDQALAALHSGEDPHQAEERIEQVRRRRAKFAANVPT